MFANLTSTITRTVVGTAGMAICAGLCLVAATAPANAETLGATALPNAATVRTQLVRYTDLDLSKGGGTLGAQPPYLAAARAVCVTGEAGAELAEMSCVRRAVVEAKAKAAAAGTIASL